VSAHDEARRPSSLFRRGVDGGYSFLPKLDSEFHEVTVVEAHVRHRRTSEHEIELERVVFVDESDLHLVRYFGGEPAGELEPTETCAEDQDIFCHLRSVVDESTLVYHPVVRGRRA